ncbi:VOC family protein [Persephonella sp.]|uniref:VOC family protein n=1 Tax=Persephonella sp. TaxID=2060922 RepID=UPI0025E62E82|nr:VOC family protein [Persephonella sp.]
MEFYIHHVGISVYDIEKTAQFYRYFGFKEVAYYTAEDGSFKIKHLKLGDFIIELFWFSDYIPAVRKDLWDDLKIGGYRHIALKVKDIHKTLEKLKKDGVADSNTQVNRGRTGILYFFIRDPDGNFVEIVQDDRNL